MLGTILRAGILIVCCIVLGACKERTTVDSATMASALPPQVIKPATLNGLKAIFESLDYDWGTLEHGVPPIILKQFPHDLDDESLIKDKKMAFFLGLLPMVLLANDEITQERDDLNAILASYDSQHELSAEQQQRLRDICTRYGLRGDPLADLRIRTRLLKRVDTVPPALVLAQAANESAWGTSRFARLGNNLFGQWTYIPGTGIIPEDRPAGEIYEVRRFQNLYESIRSYLRNLNTHWAYLEMREIRGALRKQGEPVTGLALAQGLGRYSERAEEYIAEIQAIIRHNRLYRLNQASLRDNAEADTASADTPAGLFFSRDRTRRQLALRANP